MKVVILGCGRVGARLANTLDAGGHRVSIIDRNPDAFRRFLASGFTGLAVAGIGIDEDVLRRARIEDADVFVAATNLDNVNAMASQIAQHIFHVPRVVARMYDPVREEVYQTLGLTTVCPTVVGAERIKEMLDSRWQDCAARAGG
ncbi:MAG: TrkA family potassium uptake protein [Chloroflexota bacterium]|nr:MAG: TrkA family potassium uptake protein [Chloroflexota bacterium]